MATDFTIADVLAWARTKPADAEYDYTNANHCAIAQFGKATARPHLVGLYYQQLRAIHPDLEEAVVDFDDGRAFRRTFGGLVKRLEKLCPETPVTKSDWLAIDTYLNADCGEQVA